MPTGDEVGSDVLVDTSVAVALALADHRHHLDVAEALRGRRLGLAGHAAFETFSVLTRLPPPVRRTPAAVSRLLSVNFPHSRFLSPGASAVLLDRLGAKGIAGGSIYDALVGAVAAEHGLPLATRDRRALDIYGWVNAQVEFIE